MKKEYLLLITNVLFLSIFIGIISSCEDEDDPEDSFKCGYSEYYCSESDRCCSGGYTDGINCYNSIVECEQKSGGSCETCYDKYGYSSEWVCPNYNSRYYCVNNDRCCSGGYTDGTYCYETLGACMNEGYGNCETCFNEYRNAPQWQCTDSDHPRYCSNSNKCCGEKYPYHPLTGGNSCYSSMSYCESQSGSACETCYDINGNGGSDSGSGGGGGGGGGGDSPNCPGGLYCRGANKCCPYGYFVYVSGYCYTGTDRTGNKVNIATCAVSHEAIVEQYCHPNSVKAIYSWKCVQE